LGLVIIILYGLTAYNEAAANKVYAQGQARAIILEAQGQARLDAAQAGVVTLAAMLPYAVLGLSVLVVFGELAFLLILKQSAAPVQHIETRTIILLQPGQSRRQLYRALSQTGPSASPLAGGTEEGRVSQPRHHLISRGGR